METRTVMFFVGLLVTGGTFRATSRFVEEKYWFGVAVLIPVSLFSFSLTTFFLISALFFA